MKTNETPRYDDSRNATGCCPAFNTEGWDGQSLHFENKSFARATTRSLFHIPLNMGPVFSQTFRAIEAADAAKPEETLVLSRELSPWRAEHLFAVNKDVPELEMVSLSGDFKTKVVDAPYKDAPKLLDRFEDELEAQGLDTEDEYMFYTTCPKCAKAYGHNYMIAVARVEPD